MSDETRSVNAGGLYERPKGGTRKLSSEGTKPAESGDESVATKSAERVKAREAQIEANAQRREAEEKERLAASTAAEKPADKPATPPPPPPPQRNGSED